MNTDDLLGQIFAMHQLKQEFQDKVNRMICEAVENGTLTQSQIAARIGISQPAVSKIVGRTSIPILFPTGITDLDRKTEGGIESGSLTVITQTHDGSIDTLLCETILNNIARTYTKINVLYVDKNFCPNLKSDEGNVDTRQIVGGVMNNWERIALWTKTAGSDQKTVWVTDAPVTRDGILHMRQMVRSGQTIILVGQESSNIGKMSTELQTLAGLIIVPIPSEDHELNVLSYHIAKNRYGQPGFIKLS